MYEIEIREREGREPVLHGTAIQEGRPSTGGRAEVFAPGSIQWPSEGVGIATVHLGDVETRGQMIRQPDGRLTLTARATAAVKQAYQDGKRFLSVEFVPLEERRTRAGVREILRAFVGRVAMVERPEYDMAVAEIRRVSGGDRRREDILRWL